jgi:BirA family biotin operon repressor/biotin-[acetyl-CoA-carboxylase] ligase
MKTEAFDFFRPIHLVETDSTNRYLRELGGDDNVVVWTDYQTAGRGCGSNCWESERGKNLLFSVRYHPQHIAASRQFVLLEAMALALKDTLDFCLPGERLTVKWPNDVYWLDRKLAGTLSECALNGQTIRRCIIGTGLNLNQTVFVSDAPNPVSMVQAGGGVLQPEPTLQRILASLRNRLLQAEQGEGDALHNDYCAALYRRTGIYSYRDTQGLFEARLHHIEPDGTLWLMDTDGRMRKYRFKEVRYEHSGYTTFAVASTAPL